MRRAAGFGVILRSRSYPALLARALNRDTESRAVFFSMWSECETTAPVRTAYRASEHLEHVFVSADRRQRF